MRWSYLVLLLGISLLLPTGRALSPPRHALKVRMSFAAISGAVAPIWLAKDLGLFEKNGLDVDPVLIQSGPRSVSALLSGDMPIINTGANSAIAANLGGTKEPVVIATFYNTLVFSVIGKPDIANIAGLKGKVLGFTQAGSLSDFTARLVLAQAGLAPQRDVTLLPTGDYNGMVVSLSKGLIDAGVISRRRRRSKQENWVFEKSWMSAPPESNMPARVSPRRALWRENHRKFPGAWSGRWSKLSIYSKLTKQRASEFWRVGQNRRIAKCSMSCIKPFRESICSALRRLPRKELGQFSIVCPTECRQRKPPIRKISLMTALSASWSTAAF